MIQIVHPTDEQYPLLDELSSRIFLSHKPGESMMRRYTSLMGKGNREHINMICEGGVPVSNVNWYSVQLKSAESVITAGQVGGVCSDEAFRGLGNAELLLLYSFFQMREEGVALAFISGDRSLYTRHGARHFGKEYHFMWDTPMDAALTVDIEAWEPENMVKAAGRVYRLHSESDTRIIRTFERVKEQLRGYAEPHHGYRGHLYASDFAYVVASISDEEEKPIVVTEFGGMPEDVVRIFGCIVEKTGKRLEGRLAAWQKDAYYDLPLVKSTAMEGTVVLLNPVLLFRQLGARFRAAGLRDVALIPDGMNFRIFIDGKDFTMTEEELNEAIFMGDERFGTAFPIPMPSLSSMDYQ